MSRSLQKTLVSELAKQIGQEIDREIISDLIQLRIKPCPKMFRYMRDVNLQRGDMLVVQKPCDLGKLREDDDTQILDTVHDPPVTLTEGDTVLYLGLPAGSSKHESKIAADTAIRVLVKGRLGWLWAGETLPIR